MASYLNADESSGCPIPANRKKFCPTDSSKWVWECYSAKWFASYENFDTMKAPLVFSHAIGADGIVLWESLEERKPVRCRLYKDKGFTHEMRWQKFDIYAPNQYANEIASIGPNGAVLPLGNASDNYKAMWNAQKEGVICFYDEVWPAWAWYTAGTQDDYAMHFVELSFRPRKVSYAGLIKLWEYDYKCCREKIEDNVIDYPCIPCMKPGETCGLADTTTLDDDADVKLPNGKTEKGSEAKLPHNKREGYVEPCVKTCKVDPPPDTLKFEPLKWLTNIFNALNNDINGLELNEKISDVKANTERINLNGAYETLITNLNDTSMTLSLLYTNSVDSTYLNIEGKLVDFWESWKNGSPDEEIPGIHQPQSYYASMLSIYFIHTLQSYQFISGKTFDFNGVIADESNHLCGPLRLASLNDESVEGDALKRAKNCAYLLSTYYQAINVELIKPFQEDEPGQKESQRERESVPDSESQGNFVPPNPDASKIPQDDVLMDEK